MPIKVYKPTTAARRNSSVNAYTELTTDKPHKPLLERRKKTGGRNHTGWITCRHIGGGNKQFYRKIDFKRTKDGVKAISSRPSNTIPTVRSSLPSSSTRMARALHPCLQGVMVGTEIESGTNADIEKTVGNAMPLEILPVGYEIHNIEMVPGQGGKLCRSAVAGARSVRTTAWRRFSCRRAKFARFTGSAVRRSVSWATATGSTFAGARRVGRGIVGFVRRFAAWR